MKKLEIERCNEQSEDAVAEILRAKVAHKYIGVGLSTLWLYVSQQKIKSYRLSDRVTVFKRSELDAFINGGAV